MSFVTPAIIIKPEAIGVPGKWRYGGVTDSGTIPSR
jgi:hypothetical protein